MPPWSHLLKSHLSSTRPAAGEKTLLPRGIGTIDAQL
jgi:hypothetical protein